MATLGNFSLMLALGIAIYGTIAAFFAATQAKENLRKASSRSFIVVTVLVLLTIVALGIMLQGDQFTNVYVQRHSNIALPWYYKVTAIWAGSAGSLLWWTFILCIYTCIMLLLTRKAPKLMMSWAMVFVGLCIVFFLIINNIVSNPFRIWSHAVEGQASVPFLPRDGNGMNPQLQHWAMIIHPPMLYTGYIGFLFPFAMAMGALITKMEGRAWIRMIRRWTLTAWLILGVGIVLGGAWAYMELGWGGYWAWDPVENASLMPWLLATAFIHSVMAQEVRGMFKMWNVLLLVATFLMCMFGTFITRSGLISSVHAFAESDIGNYFIGYILINAILALIVVIYGRSVLKDDNPIDAMSSREVSYLFNNVLFITLCVITLVGVIQPLVTEFLEGTKIEVRHGYFNTYELPFLMAMVVLMGIGPILTWKKTSNMRLKQRFLLPTIAAIVVFAVAFVLNKESLMATFSFATLTFLLVTIIEEFVRAGTTRAKRASESLPVAIISMIRLNKRRYGGYIAHFAVFLIGLGITGSAFNHQDKKELGIGQTMTVGPHVFQVESIERENNDLFFKLMAKVNLLENGKATKSFYPEQRFYHASQSQASEVGIGITPIRDYYVVLAGAAQDSTPEHPVGVFHIYVNPLVVWIWVGTFFMVLGTAICMLPDKVRASSSVKVPQGALGEVS